MGSAPPQLSLDFRPAFVPKTITDLLREVSLIGNAGERVSRLDDFVTRLEEEMRKIDAFKRELPLCMLLLTDAIRALREESVQFAAPLNAAGPVFEEFIPLKKSCDEEEEEEDVKKEKDCRDKKNWMSSLQLWSADNGVSTDVPGHVKQNCKVENKRSEEQSRFATDDLFQTCKNRGGGRVFLPLKPYPGFAAAIPKKEEKEELPVHGLSLLTPGMKSREETGSSGSKSSGGRAASSSAPAIQSNLRAGSQQQQQQLARKQRRCWSPELHRRFVNALQQLGGAQVATPKQIRELMQVEGLTNDEVKSHLQKYRLHTRRLPAATATPSNQPVVVLGGLWMAQDQYGDSSKVSSSQSGSPQGPLQLTGNTGGTSITGGDSLEDDEDEKSESYTWKTHIHKPGKNI